LHTIIPKSSTFKDVTINVYIPGTGEKTLLLNARGILSITGLSITECGVEGAGAKFEIVITSEKFRKQET
jgi:hypothetical protein